VNDLLAALWRKVKSLWRRNPEPQDPYAGVRAPLKRSPQGRSSAVALAEPEESPSIQARAWSRSESRPGKTKAPRSEPLF
jgi:hypothetical protein